MNVTVVNQACKSINMCLSKQMESELQQFENERADRIRQLHEKNKRETEEFDMESMEKGIR